MNTSYLTKSQLEFFGSYFNVDMINAIKTALNLNEKWYHFQCFKFAERLKYTFGEVAESMKKTHKLIDEFFELPYEEQTPETFEAIALESIPAKKNISEFFELGHIEEYEDTYLRICIEFFKKKGYVYHIPTEMIRRNTILVFMFNKKHDELEQMAWKLHKFNAIYGKPEHYNAPETPINDIELLKENFKFFFPLAGNGCYDMTAEGILEELEERNLLDVVFKKTGTNVQANTKERLTFENGVIVKKIVSANITREIYE